MNTSRFTKAIGWLDERTGIKHTMTEMLDEPIRGGSRWAYIFGSTLLFLFTLQVVTGIFLTLYYVPSSDHAHASVAYIQKAVPGGALLRGLHHYGSSAMVILAVAHLAQVYLFGAYKQKRELVWGLGTVLLLLIFGFAFTGYLLPWDQASYFGTKVGTSIAGEVPVVGRIQERIMLGGTDLTSLTLSRFFTAHVFLFPLGMAILMMAHVYLFRKVGPAGPFHDRDDAKVETFYPGQLFKDSVAILVLFVALVSITKVWPAELGPEADPSSDYLARPPWYFLPLFQLLKYFPGKFSVIPTVVLPGVIFTMLFLLPFVDRRKERHPWRRPMATAALLLILVAAGVLIGMAKYEDRTSPDFSAKLKAQDEEMHSFLSSPFKPQIIGGSAAALPATSDSGAGEPPAAYAEKCAACHGERGEGALFQPLLGVSAKPNRSKEDLVKILNDSTSYGLKKPMPQSFPSISEEDKQKIAEWLSKLK